MLFKRFALILMLAAGWLVHLAPAAVEAQASATLLILPAESEVFLNNSKTINLVVLGGVDVNAFDVTIRYDPQVLTLESWEYGDYLSSLARVYLRDDPGEFRLAATQLARPGVNGDGILLTFTFKGTGEGSSAIDIAAATFSTPGGVRSTRCWRMGCHGDRADQNAHSDGYFHSHGKPHHHGDPHCQRYSVDDGHHDGNRSSRAERNQHRHSNADRDADPDGDAHRHDQHGDRGAAGRDRDRSSGTGSNPGGRNSGSGFHR